MTTKTPGPAGGSPASDNMYPGGVAPTPLGDLADCILSIEPGPAPAARTRAAPLTRAQLLAAVVDCPRCGGTGVFWKAPAPHTIEDPCRGCGGAGSVYSVEKLRELVGPVPGAEVGP